MKNARNDQEILFGKVKTLYKEVLKIREELAAEYEALRRKQKSAHPNGQEQARVQ